MAQPIDPSDPILRGIIFVAAILTVIYADFRIGKLIEKTAESEELSPLVRTGSLFDLISVSLAVLLTVHLLVFENSYMGFFIAIPMPIVSVGVMYYLHVKTKEG